MSQARFPAIDMHAHVYARTPEQVDEWVRTMDEVGVQKSIVMTQATEARSSTRFMLSMPGTPTGSRSGAVLTTPGTTSPASVRRR